MKCAIHKHHIQKSLGLRLLCGMVAITSLMGCGSSVAPASIEQSPVPDNAVDNSTSIPLRGWIVARDGTRLRYHLVLPEGPGPFPTVINYDGYAAGSDVYGNGVRNFAPTLLERGYALLGVSVRGTGCSDGEFKLFEPKIGEDGYDAVEWAAAQPFSNGRIGMLGTSFGGITQLHTASQRPPHLNAIVPSSSTADLYRDIVFPGGIYEYGFPVLWTALQKGQYSESITDSQIEDPECLPIIAAQYAANLAGANIPALAVLNPFIDDKNLPDGLAWRERDPVLENIQIPALMFNAWQDEIFPGRTWTALERFPLQKLLWTHFTNGQHARDSRSATDIELSVDFLDRFVKNINNGFEKREPRVVLPMESKLDGASAWAIKRSSLQKLQPSPVSFHLREGGLLSPDLPTGDEAGDSYLYPLATPSLITGAGGWSASLPANPGALSYTTNTLSNDMVLAGPASVDLWITSTSDDVDLQATISEVRPDGQEMYVQRGWLRTSHRRMDEQASTVFQPIHTHRRADFAPLTPNEATYIRFEVFPFAHAFRANSKLRLTIETPTGTTGLWAFAFNPIPSTVTVLHDAMRPSRLVVGQLVGEKAGAPLPACVDVASQPCRTDSSGL